MAEVNDNGKHEISTSQQICNCYDSHRLTIRVMSENYVFMSFCRLPPILMSPALKKEITMQNHLNLTEDLFAYTQCSLHTTKNHSKSTVYMFIVYVHVLCKSIHIHCSKAHETGLIAICIL